jgi:hypothetical protein
MIRLYSGALLTIKGGFVVYNIVATYIYKNER